MKIETRIFLQQLAAFWIMLIVSMPARADIAQEFRDYAHEFRKINSECAKLDPSTKSQEFFKCQEILLRIGSMIINAEQKRAAIWADFPRGSFPPLVIRVTNRVLNCATMSGGYKKAAFRMRAGARFLQCIEPAAEMARQEMARQSIPAAHYATTTAPEDDARESLTARNRAYERDTDAMIVRHRAEEAQGRAQILQEELLESARAQTEELRRIRERIQY